MTHRMPESRPEVRPEARASRAGLLRRALLPLAVFVAFAFAGCLGKGGSLTDVPRNENAFVKLKVLLGRIDTYPGTNPVVVAKRSSIRLDRMVVTFRSNLNDVVIDTLDSWEIGTLGGELRLADSVIVNVSLRALRWWNVDIQTFDENDSLIHNGTTKSPFASMGGHTINLAVPLIEARYLSYEARYALPSVIYAAGTSGEDRTVQRIYFHRLVLKIDGVTVGDSSSFNLSAGESPSRFITADPTALRGAAGSVFFKPNGALPDTAVHIQFYPYVEVGERTFEMSAYGYLEGDSVGGPERLLYQGETKMNVALGSPDAPPPQVNVGLDWKGPGAARPDTTSGASTWNGINMTVRFGRVLSGSVTVDVDPTVPFKRAPERTPGR